MDLKDMNQKMDIQKSCIFPPALGESLPGSEVGPLEDPQRPSRTHRKDDLLMDTHPGMVKTMDSDFGKCFFFQWYRILSNRKSAYIFLPTKTPWFKSHCTTSYIDLKLRHVVELSLALCLCANFLTLTTKFYTIFWCNNMPSIPT